jgi:hypothetical protein
LFVEVLQKDAPFYTVCPVRSEIAQEMPLAIEMTGDCGRSIKDY